MKNTDVINAWRKVIEGNNEFEESKNDKYRWKCEMDFVETLTKILKEKHGKDLDLKNDAYYLFLKDGLFSLYFDEDEKSIKVNIEFLPEDNTFIYFSDEELEKLMS